MNHQRGSRWRHYFTNRFAGTGPLVITLSLLACVGVAAYSLQLAPTAHQRLQIETRFR